MYRSNQSITALKALTIFVFILFAFACKKDEEEETPVTPPPAPEPSDTLYYNEFNDGTTTGWEVINGDWILDNDVYRVSHDTTLYAMTCALDTILTDYIFEVRARKVSGEIYNVGIAFNGDPSNTTPLGNWSNVYKLIIGTNQYWNLTRIKENLPNTLADGTSAMLNAGMGSWNVIRVVVSDGKIQIIFNDNIIGTYNDNALISGKVGITMFDESYQGVGEFDYVMISKIPDGYQWGTPAKKISVPLPEETFEGDKP